MLTLKEHDLLSAFSQANGARPQLEFTRGNSLRSRCRLVLKPKGKKRSICEPFSRQLFFARWVPHVSPQGCSPKSSTCHTILQRRVQKADVQLCTETESPEARTTQTNKTLPLRLISSLKTSVNRPAHLDLILFDI